MELVDINLEKPTEINMVKSIMDLFPPKHNLDKSKLKMSNVGLYSITPYKEADSLSSKILDKLEKYGLGELTITDATGGMGGNTISFTKYFKKVNSVELSREHYDILKNNIETVYQSENVQLYNEDYTKIYKNLTQDIIYFDPPWGGPDYKKYSKLKLYLGGTTIDRFIRDNLLEMDELKMIVIKVPRNFDYNSFIETIGTDRRVELESGKNKYNLVYIYI